MNNQKAPFTDARVRTALKLGLNSDIIANKVKGRGQPASLWLYPAYTDGAKLTEPEWFKWSREAGRDEEGKKLLAEAGYPADKPADLQPAVQHFQGICTRSWRLRRPGWRKNLGVRSEAGKPGMENLPRHASPGDF
ncbi:ABC transporter substrate-binding protein [Shigella flexneri]